MSSEYRYFKDARAFDDQIRGCRVCRAAWKGPGLYFIQEGHDQCHELSDLRKKAECHE